MEDTGVGREKHLIVGRGNLGLDLELQLRNAGKHAVAVSVGRALAAKAAAEEILAYDADVIWYCIGGYTAGDQGDEMLDRMLTLPVTLARDKGNHRGLVVFSSDYAADERYPELACLRAPTSRSPYAGAKAEMERVLLNGNIPNTLIFRVTTLYGEWHPERTLPGKIIRNHWASTKLARLPWNRVTPTPTAWVAALLAKHAWRLMEPDGCYIHHAAPALNVPVASLAKYVLPERKLGWSQIEFYDNARPHVSKLGCDFLDSVPDWLTLWKAYFHRERYVPSDFPIQPVTGSAKPAS